jgi:hypothetical protein
VFNNNYWIKAIAAENKCNNITFLNENPFAVAKGSHI